MKKGVPSDSRWQRDQTRQACLKARWRICIHICILWIYIYVYIYISEVKGSSYGLSYPLEREIDFDFDFDSSVPCVAGEAKLCVRVRRASLTLGLILGSCPAASRRVFEPYFMLGMWVLITFTRTSVPRALYLLYYVWVLTIQ